MKSLWICLSLAVLFAVPEQSFAEWSQPDAAQIEGLLSSPSGMSDLVDGATPEQAADVVLKAIAEVDASTTLTDTEKQQLIARLVGYAVIKMGSRAPDMLALIVGNVDDVQLSTVAAVAVTAGRDYANAIRSKIVAALGGGRNSEIPVGRGSHE